MALAELRERVGMVTQDVQLFRATVRDNLSSSTDSFAMNRSSPSARAGPWRLAPLASARVEHRAGGRRQGLSREAQLLAFARVFLKNPGW